MFDWPSTYVCIRWSCGLALRAGHACGAAVGCQRTLGNGCNGLLVWWVGEGLVARLKGWYVSHHEEVRQEAGPSRSRLCAAVFGSAEAPALNLELMDLLVDWGRDAKRQRK